MTTIAERIIQIAEKKCNGTLSAFAKKVGISPSYMSKLKAEPNSVPSDMCIINICNTFGVDENWLRTGEGSMERVLDKSEELENFFKDIIQTDANSDGEKCRRSLISALARIPTDKWEEIAVVLYKLVEDYNDAN